jgi:hypothetical protein
MADSTEALQAQEAQPKPRPRVRPSQQVEYDKTIFEVQVSECVGFYKLVIYLDVLFLAGTLAFLERIAPNLVQWTLILLMVGWTMLVVSTWFVVRTRRYNIEAARLNMVKQHDSQEEIETKARWYTDWSGHLFAAGAGCVMLFGFLNAWHTAGIKASSVNKDGQDGQRQAAQGAEVVRRDVRSGDGPEAGTD